MLNVSNEFINFGTGNEIEMDSIANLSCWYRMVSPTVTVVTHIKLIWIMTCHLCLLNQTFDMTIESLKKILFTLLYPSCAVNHYMYLQQNFIFLYCSPTALLNIFQNLWIFCNWYKGCISNHISLYVTQNGLKDSALNFSFTAQINHYSIERPIMIF